MAKKKPEKDPKPKEKKQSKNRDTSGLIPFEPGQSGNPNGRPEGSRNRSTIIRKLLGMKGVLPDKMLEGLQKMFPEVQKNTSVEEVMHVAMLGRVITKQDPKAYTAIMDNAYGKQKQEVTGADGAPLIPHNPYSGMSLEELQAIKAKLDNEE